MNTWFYNINTSGETPDSCRPLIKITEFIYWSVSKTFWLIHYFECLLISCQPAWCTGITPGLAAQGSPVRILLPPEKDWTEWTRDGGTCPSANCHRKLPDLAKEAPRSVLWAWRCEPHATTTDESPWGRWRLDRADEAKHQDPTEPLNLQKRTIWQRETALRLEPVPQLSLRPASRVTLCI